MATTQIIQGACMTTTCTFMATTWVRVSFTTQADIYIMIIYNIIQMTSEQHPNDTISMTRNQNIYRNIE